VRGKSISEFSQIFFATGREKIYISFVFLSVCRGRQAGCHIYTYGHSFYYVYDPLEKLFTPPRYRKRPVFFAVRGERENFSCLFNVDGHLLKSRIYIGANSSKRSPCLGILLFIYLLKKLVYKIDFYSLLKMGHSTFDMTWRKLKETCFLFYFKKIYAVAQLPNERRIPERHFVV